MVPVWDPPDRLGRFLVIRRMPDRDHGSAAWNADIPPGLCLPPAPPKFATCGEAVMGEWQEGWRKGLMRVSFGGVILLSWWIIVSDR